MAAVMASLRSLPAFVPPRNDPQESSLGYKDLLFFKLQQCSFSLSHLSDKTCDQNNEKPRRESQKRSP